MAVNDSYKVHKGVNWSLTFDDTANVPLWSSWIRRSFNDIKNPEGWNTAKAGETPYYALFKGKPVFALQEMRVYFYVGSTVTAQAIANENNWEAGARLSDIVRATNYVCAVDNRTELANTTKTAGNTYFERDTGKFITWNANGDWDETTIIMPTKATTAGEADTALALSVPIIVNGMTVNGGSVVTNFVLCSAAASVPNKITTSTQLPISLVQGAELKVKFENGNTNDTPKIYNKPIKKGNVAYTTWNAGDIVRMTYVEANGGEWQVHNEDIDFVTSKFTKTSFMDFDFDNNTADGLPGIVNAEQHPVALNAYSGENLANVQNTLFGKMQNLWNAPDGKLHFIKFKGVPCSFDIDDAGSDSVTFSFLHKMYGSEDVNVGVEHLVRMITIVWTKQQIGNNPPTFSYQYIVKKLGSGNGGNGGGDTTELAQAVNTLAARVATLEESTYWYNFDLSDEE